MHASRKKRMLTMTQGSLFKNILVFALPLMLSNVLQVLFNMSDVAVVGRFSSDANALGAVGSTATYVTLFTGLMIGFGTGVNAVMAQRIGSADEDGQSRVAHTGFIISVVFGAAVMALAMGLARPVLTLMGTKPEFLEGALKYVYIYFTGAVGTAVYNFGNGVFSADGDTRRPLAFLASAGVTNVLLNLFFVIVCGMSVDGVALASTISQWLSCALIVVALARTRRAYRLRLSRMRPDKKYAGRILMLGIPAGIQNAIFQIANLFIQSGINTFGPEVVEGNTAAVNADNIVFELMAAVYTACTSFMGQNFGAGKRDRIIKSYMVSLAYSFAFGLVLGLALFFGADVFLSLFTDDPSVMEAGRQRLSVMCLSYGISAFMDCTIAAARGINKTVIPTVMVILGSCVFRIFWVFCIFPVQGTTTLLYALYPVSWTITAIAEIAYFIHAYRRAVRVLTPPPAAPQTAAR